MTTNIGAQIIDRARVLGADLAGIADYGLLCNSPSHQWLRCAGGVGEVSETFEASKTSIVCPSRPAPALSVLVLALAHPRNRPELDWWDDDTTPGNRELIRIGRRLAARLDSTLGLRVHDVPYGIDEGGTFLKDAAVQAGLGSIGRNNLLITPEFGPRVRLRALLIVAELVPAGPVPFDPCAGCAVYCRLVCPREAFALPTFPHIDAGLAAQPAGDGRFDRERCLVQMDEDVVWTRTPGGRQPVRYCRLCEQTCPVGK